MKIALTVVVGLVTIVGCKHPKETTEDTYMITSHTVVVQADSLCGQLQEDDYTVTYGADVLKVKYASSQTTTAKPGDPPGKGLHPHFYYSDPDLSQVPQVGVSIRRCELSTIATYDGSPSIAVQSTPDPCMIQLGDTLRYEPSPNAGNFTYVNFDVLSEMVR
jgi:hypothetical protein